MKKTIKLLLSYSWILLFFLTACTKLLDVKADKKLTVPETLEDFQAILNGPDLNTGPSEGEIMAGDYYLSHADFDALFCESDIETYSWRDSRFVQPCDGDNGWTRNYNTIYRANVVIEGVQDIEKRTGASVNSSTVKGHAYFSRAINHFEVALLWAPYYDGKNGDDLGIPLKLIADFNLKTERPSLEHTFNQIIKDLSLAAELLPMTRHTNRWPGRYAAWAYLSRVYTYLNNLDSAGYYANKCIEGQHHQLLDYNKVNVTANFPFNLDSNPEVFVPRYMTGAYYSLNINLRRIQDTIFKSYTAQDLRKIAFFRTNADGSIRFKGGQSGSGSLFSGPTMGEMYLVLAEMHARNGNYSEGRKHLKELLKHRMHNTFIVPEIPDDKLLEVVLAERHKELIMRGVRFLDVKRLNKFGESITLRRIIKGEEHTLPPNDPRFTLLIPHEVIRISGIIQNAR